MYLSSHLSYSSEDQSCEEEFPLEIASAQSTITDSDAPSAPPQLQQPGKDVLDSNTCSDELAESDSESEGRPNVGRPRHFRQMVLQQNGWSDSDSDDDVHGYSLALQKSLSRKPAQTKCLPFGGSTGQSVPCELCERMQAGLLSSSSTMRCVCQGITSQPSLMNPPGATTFTFFFGMIVWPSLYFIIEYAKLFCATLLVGGRATGWWSTQLLQREPLLQEGFHDLASR